MRYDFILQSIQHSIFYLDKPIFDTLHEQIVVLLIHFYDYNFYQSNADLYFS